MADDQPTPEQWRPIPGYEGLYEVSDHGRVKSLGRVTGGPYGSKRRVPPRILKPGMKRHGHLFVNLYNAEGKTNRTVHTLVAEAFIGPRPAKMYVCHWNDIPDDNRLENLRYATPRENGRDMVRNGNSNTANKTRCPRGHEYTGANLYVKSGGGRRCRACTRAHGVVEFRPELRPQFDQIADEKYRAIMLKETA